MKISSIVYILQFLSYSNTFKYWIDDGPITLTKSVKNEYKLVNFILTKKIQADIENIIKWSKQINFNTILDKMKTLKGEDKKYLQLTLYNLLDIGYRADSIQSSLDQWKNLQTHSLSSTVNENLKTSLENSNDFFDFTLTKNNQLGAIKVGELLAKLQPFTNDINGLLLDVNKQETLRSLIHDITVTSTLLDSELKEIGSSLLQMVRGQVPPNVNFKLMKTENYYDSNVQGCTIADFKITCLLNTAIIMNTEQYIQLINIPYNGYALCNILIRKDNTIFELIGNKAEYTECAKSIQHFENDVVNRCELCVSDEKVLLARTGKILLPKKVQISPKYSIATYPALLAFNTNLKIADQTYKRTLSPHVDYSELSIDEQNLFKPSINDDMDEFFKDHGYYLYMPLTVLLLVSPVIVCILNIYKKSKNRIKLTGQNRAAVNAIKRKNQMQKSEKNNVLLKNIAA